MVRECAEAPSTSPALARTNGDVHAGAKLVCIESLQVRADRVRAHVSCSPSVRMTTPELAHKVCELRPLLPKHACVNGKGSTFAAVIQHTPIIHLLEHVVVDILTEQSSATDKIFVGTSEWVDYDAGRGRVEVSYCDDLEAIAAFKSAEELINTLL